MKKTKIFGTQEGRAYRALERCLAFGSELVDLLRNAFGPISWDVLLCEMLHKTFFGTQEGRAYRALERCLAFGSELLHDAEKMITINIILIVRLQAPA